MKKYTCFLTLILVISMILSLSCCSPIDDKYGVSSQPQDTETVNYPKNVEIPKIKSTDTVMPLYFDISLYDEENYSKIYLGKRYEYNAQYDGVTIDVPTNYKTLNESGWQVVDSNAFGVDSTIKAGTLQKVVFTNGKSLLSAYFHNEDDKTALLFDCDIIRLAIEENHIISHNTDFGWFNINGITNNSAITDIFFTLGAPSHFHADTETEYTLNWFKTEKDRRNKITISIDTENDCVTYIAISAYK